MRAVGFVAQMKGRLTHGLYTVATIFVDHYSRLGYVHLQKDASSGETLKAKRASELYASQRGIKIRHYHADNGRFADNAWRNVLLEENQGITYCGANAHWQNGIAERRIRDLKEQSRTMLLHAEHHWPDAIFTSLWPYAMRTACQICNDAPTLKGDQKDRTPEEVFSGTSIAAEVRHHHTFGCPAYVTAGEIQSGKSLPTWMSRARVGIHIGISPTHARSVSLVLSLKTGLALPQFHVKHDDLFETTDTRAGWFGLPRSKWQALAGLTKKLAALVPQRIDSTREGTQPPRGAHAGGQHRGTKDRGEVSTPQGDALSAADNESGQDGADDSISGNDDELDDDETVVLEGEPELTPPSDAPPTTRSGRRVRLTTRMKESIQQEGKKWLSWMASALRPPELSPEGEIYKVLATTEYDIQDRALDPISFSATSDPDTMYWHQAMQQSDKAEFIKAAIAEVKSHVDNEHFVLMRRDELPEGNRVLAAVWSMKRNRHILARLVYKWKARLNCQLGQQEHGINFWETYSPVVNWYSIRLFLIISILRGWETR
jgi:hypothetical protein